MAASIIVEEEAGTCRTIHSHNGYYAGEFRDIPFEALAPTTFRLR